MVVRKEKRIVMHRQIRVPSQSAALINCSFGGVFLGDISGASCNFAIPLDLELLNGQSRGTSPFLILKISSDLASGVLWQLKPQILFSNEQVTKIIFKSITDKVCSKK